MHIPSSHISRLYPAFCHSVRGKAWEQGCISGVQTQNESNRGAYNVTSKNTPMSDELKWLLKEEGGHSCRVMN